MVRERASGKVATGKESRGVPEITGPLNGKVKIGAENGKGSVTTWKGAQRESALTDCRGCSLLRSPVGDGPAPLRCKLPASLSL